MEDGCVHQKEVDTRGRRDAAVSVHLETCIDAVICLQYSERVKEARRADLVFDVSPQMGTVVADVEEVESRWSIVPITA
jgi:hypothetical protein